LAIGFSRKRAASSLGEREYPRTKHCKSRSTRHVDLRPAVAAGLAQPLQAAYNSLKFAFVGVSQCDERDLSDAKKFRSHVLKRPERYAAVVRHIPPNRPLAGRKQVS
jgi:hypothetical protein